MKPTTPIDTEMVFLRDVENRLRRAYNKQVEDPNRNCIPELLGLTSVVNCRIAEVTKLRDKENADVTRHRDSERESSRSLDGVQEGIGSQ